MYWHRLLLAATRALLAGGGTLVLLAGSFRGDRVHIAPVVAVLTVALVAAVVVGAGAGWFIAPRHRALHMLTAGVVCFLAGATTLVLLAIVSVLLS